MCPFGPLPASAPLRSCKFVSPSFGDKSLERHGQHLTFYVPIVVAVIRFKITIFLGRFTMEDALFDFISKACSKASFRKGIEYVKV